MTMENPHFFSELPQTIQAINRETVHRICSGQVVLSLAIAVKELIENSLDAGATIINIDLKEYGSEMIEVSDNGTGVEPNNFQVLTLKHFTSKIRQFDDLASLSTLGFRGEALSSLCALSDLTIKTKHVSSDNASTIKYDKNGKIISENVCAREVGTTVVLENLFSNLPVRRKEFLKNLKREFNKLCQFLYAYCLVSKGVKFVCSNVSSKGNKSVVVSTDGLKTVRDNIVNVFGTKQVASLVEVEALNPKTEVLNEYQIEGVEPSPFSLEFFISSVLHGSGRSTTDRQFFYINSRPCEPPKLPKLINETYKQYNSNQYPFVFLNVTTRSCLVDVNVTPDKRQVFLEKEKLLLATVKSSLIETFKVFPSTYKLENLELSQNSVIEDFFGQQSRGLKRNATECASVKRGSILQRFQKRSKTENDKGRSVTSFFERSRCNSDDFLSTFVEEKKIDADEEIEETKIDCRRVSKENKECVSINKIKEEQTLTLIVQVEKRKIKEPDFTEKDESKSHEIQPLVLEQEPKKLGDDLDISFDTNTKDRSMTVKSKILQVSFDDISNRLEQRQQKAKLCDDVRVRFRCKIDPNSNKSAEDELRKQICKEDFSKMEVIGQFNLGFIVAKLKNDLFIIDQHASDEKYNFEQLQTNTVMENQVLVNPKQLQLTAGNESILIENEEIFTKNGFTFKIDPDAPCTKKVSLLSVPLSKNVIFGKDDIDEMLFMLQDSNHTMCRPSRIRGMFASRACRKSVMIGKSLSPNDMKVLINHMGEIKQPWNCPHGRPTMRHLINLDLIQQDQI